MRPGGASFAEVSGGSDALMAWMEAEPVLLTGDAEWHVRHARRRCARSHVPCQCRVRNRRASRCAAAIS
jgi:hypothetical protein